MGVGSIAGMSPSGNDEFAFLDATAQASSVRRKGSDAG